VESYRGVAQARDDVFACHYRRGVLSRGHREVQAAYLLGLECRVWGLGLGFRVGGLGLRA